MGIGRQVARGVCWSAVAVLAAVQLQPALAGALTPSAAVTVEGDAPGLVPGQPATLVLTVRNPGSRPVVVRALDTAVRVEEGTCSSSALQVELWRGRLAVPAGGSASQPVAVRLAEDCADVRFTLVYSAS